MSRPDEAQQLLLDYLYQKSERIFDVQLDAQPFSKYAIARGRDRPPELYDLVLRLHKKGFLHRLQHGRYVGSREREPARSPRLADLDPIAAAVIRRLDLKYFLSWHSALWHHGLIDQQARHLYVAVRQQKRPVKIGLVEVRFIRIAERKFFGGETVKLEWPVNIASVEKAIIDSLDMPRLAASVPVVADAMRRASHGGKLDPEKLVAATIKFKSPTVTRRVGFLMDLYEIPGSDPLTKHLGRDYAVPLTPGAIPKSREQTVNRRWHVYEDPAVISAALELK